MATRAVPGVLIVVGMLAACGADAPDGVAAPGLEGAPREVTLEAPTLPTTTDRIESTTTTTSASTPEEADPDASTTSTEPAAEAAAADDQPDAADATGEGDPAPTTTVDDPFLRRGDEGPAVVSLQQRLIALEYLAAGGDTGVFDAATADALIDFQAQYGLVVDGIFGPQSDRALNAAAASVTDG